MAPKRSSVGGDGAKAAKAARRTVEPWQPALDVVAKASKSLPKSCVSMMNAAIPHVFNVTKEERHAYQNSVIEGLMKIGADEEERLKAGIVAVEAEVQSLTQEKEAFDSNYATATADAAAKNQDKVSKEEASSEKQTAAAEAAKAKADQDATVVEAEAAVKAAAATKQAFESDMAGWEALVNCTFAKKDWRARNKAIAVIVSCLTTASAPQSLQAAITEVLKGSLERTEFAKASLEHGENALKDHVAKAAAAITELEGAVAQQKQAAETAEQSKTSAQEASDAAMQVGIDAANVWVDAANTVQSLQKTKAGFSEREEELTGELAQKQDEVTAFSDLFHGKVQGLVDGVAAAEEEAAEPTAPTPKSARKSEGAPTPQSTRKAEE